VTSRGVDFSGLTELICPSDFLATGCSPKYVNTLLGSTFF